MRRIITSAIFGLSIWMGVAACTSASPSDAPKTSFADTANRESTVEPLNLTVPSGTYMTVELQNGISTEKSSPGDSFNGVLSKDVIVDGLTAFEKGSIVRGRVLEVHEPGGRVKGLAQLKLELTSVEHNGKTIPIQTQTYVGIAHHHTKNHDAETKGDATGDKAALIDGGAGRVLATNGEQLHYPPETRLLFTLATPVEI
jgi:hypothetical protein